MRSPVSLIGAGKVIPADKKLLGFGSLCFGFREEGDVYNDMKTK